jgi:single-strand DNA-binding protein
MNATIFGRIGRDAELRQTSSGTSVAQFSVALNVYNKSGESKPTWVRAAVYGGQADSLAQYLIKGTTVALSGDLVLREYDNRDGGRSVSLDMNVNAVSLLGGGQKQEQPAARPAQRAQQRPAKRAVSTQRPASRPAPQAQDAEEPYEASDDDIGF